MRIRRLTAADIEVWRRVAETVTPRAGSLLPPRAPGAASPPDPAATPGPTVAHPQPAPARRYEAASYRPPVSVPKPPPTGLERRFKRRVAGGRIPVEGVLDLHGMTQAEAHAALHRFILNAQRDGARLVMVVTGKGLKERGRTDVAEPGVLRRAVPFWLRDGTLRAAVIGFEEAALGHGGAGALYVRLRRPDT